MPKQINLRLPDSVLAALEEQRGPLSREAWLREAVEARLAPGPTKAQSRPAPKGASTGEVKLSPGAALAARARELKATKPRLDTRARTEAFARRRTAPRTS